MRSTHGWASRHLQPDDGCRLLERPTAQFENPAFREGSKLSNLLLLADWSNFRHLKPRKPLLRGPLRDRSRKGVRVSLMIVEPTALPRKVKKASAPSLAVLPLWIEQSSKKSGAGLLNVTRGFGPSRDPDLDPLSVQRVFRKVAGLYPEITCNLLRN